MKRFKVYTKEKGIVETDDYNDFAGLTLHREDGPAYIENGNITHVSYWVNDSRHRLDGPAVIEYDGYGNIKYEAYFINDIHYKKVNYHKELLKLKVKSL